MDYVKKTRRVSTETMLKAEHYVNIGYQKILTFERPGGGFDWWGTEPALPWLTAYGIQQLTATAKVYDIDRNVITRAHEFLIGQQSADGSWGVVGGTHGETISAVKKPNIALTAYIVWSLAEAGIKSPSINKALAYLKAKQSEASGNPYLLSLMANAFVFANSPEATSVLAQLQRLKKESASKVWWQYRGSTASLADGDYANIETTALAVYAFIAAKKYITTINKSLNFLVEKKSASGTWGSTQATILALKALLAAQNTKTENGPNQVEIFLNQEQAGVWKINDQNRDVMQLLDLGTKTQTGKNTVKLNVAEESGLKYQIVTRYYLPWKKAFKAKEKLAIDIAYDRRQLKKDDAITANVAMHYRGKKSTYMVIVDLGIPPGFTVNTESFAQLVRDKKIERYSTTSRQITLYLGRVEPNSVFRCSYKLKAKYPLRAKTPKSVVYEYYSPDNRAISQPVELEVK